MGIGIARILTIDGPQRLKTRTLLVYIAQLFFNFCWSLIFFNAQAFLFAFIWLIALWILILIMILLFAKQSKWAAWLQLPYLIWVSFAGYLNLGVWILNSRSFFISLKTFSPNMLFVVVKRFFLWPFTSFSFFMIHCF